MSSAPDSGAAAGSSIRRTVSVVIPCKNEALNLPGILTRLPPFVSEVVVVDSDCIDNTVDVALSLRPDAVIIRSDGQGKGRALRSGMLAATGDVIVTMDGDGSNDPGEIPAMLRALDAGARLVKGSRYMQGGGSVDSTLMRDAGSRVICHIFNVLHGTRHTDLLYGFMAYRRSDREVVLPDCEGFDVEAAINAQAARAGLVVTEVPSVEHRRVHGTSNLHPLRDGTRILRTIISERRSQR